MFFKDLKYQKSRNKKLTPRLNSPARLLGKRRGAGFTLLYAALVGSIALSIVIGLISITLKSRILSSFGRESVHAFFAADGGGECALMWDISHPGFTQTVFPTSTDSFPPSSGISCYGQDIASSWTITQTANAATTTFDLVFQSNRCANVVVAKTDDGLVTRVTSRGYNTCSLTDPRRVERGLRINY